MSNIHFKNCNFTNCNIHVGDNNSSNGNNSEMSSALALGGLLLGGAIYFPTLLSSVVPMCILWAKGFLLGTTVYCGLNTVKILAKSSMKYSDVPKLTPPKDTGDYIELEPTRVYDENDFL